MRLCYLANLKPGMVLGQPIFGYYGGRRTLLLGRNAELSGAIIQKLEQVGYPYIYIEEKGTEEVFPEDILSEATRDMSMLAISQYYDELRDVITEMKRKGTTSNDLIKANELYIKPPKSAPLIESVNEIIQDLFNLDSEFGYQTISGIPKTNAIHSHTLNVTVISLLLAYQFAYTLPEQKELGLGALLHDIGKAVITEVYEKQYWELDAEETRLMQYHPEMGEKLLRNSQVITETVRQSIIQHHERQDGTGYPSQLIGDNSKPLKTHYAKPRHIFRFAEIISVANTFDNLINGTYYNHRFSPKEALDELAKEAGTGLNLEVVQSLNSLVTLFPVGVNVKIINHLDGDLVGATGVVSRADKSDNKDVEVIILWDKNGKRIEPQKESLHMMSIQMM